MINQFTTEATSIVFTHLTTNPELYERAITLVKQKPASSINELKSWTKDLSDMTTSLYGDSMPRALVDAALRDVRWTEIRSALQREAH